MNFHPDESITLESRNLVKRYRKRVVVNQVSIRVNQGEIVGLLGPNGAGKTTTFYMFTGIVRPNKGKVYLNNEDITRKPMYQRARMGIGYLSQEPSVFRNLTVRQNRESESVLTGLLRSLACKKLPITRGTAFPGVREGGLKSQGHLLQIQNLFCWMSPLQGWIR